MPTDTQRNPYVPFAATIEDMVPGTRLLIVGYNDRAQVTKINVKQPPVYVGSINAYCLFPTQCPSWFLGDMGVCSSGGRMNVWSDNTVTIVNTRANRMKLYRWLISRGGKHDLQAATAIAMLYPRVGGRRVLQRAC